MNGRIHALLVKNVLEIHAQGKVWCDDVLTVEKENCTDQMLFTLEDAQKYLNREFGSSKKEWTWGRLHQTQYSHNPFSEVPYLKPLFHQSIENGGDKYTLNVASHKASNPFHRTHNPSLRMLIDLADWKRQRWILGTGQSGNLLSPHYDDQMQSHRDGEYLVVDFGDLEMEGVVLILKPRP